MSDKDVFFYLFYLTYILRLFSKRRWGTLRIWSVLLYGVEGWTLKVSEMNRLEPFEKWVYCRVLKIPWTARTTNRDVLKRLGKDQEILTTIKGRKTAYLGHMHNTKYELLQRIIQTGKNQRKRIGT